jgi:hypothetical protein
MKEKIWVAYAEYYKGRWDFHNVKVTYDDKFNPVYSDVLFVQILTNIVYCLCQSQYVWSELDGIDLYVNSSGKYEIAIR